MDVPRLATYGTLMRGRSNHHEMDGIAGRWVTGTVRGIFHADGWEGYPGLDLDPSGPPVVVDVLESEDLEAHWARLDDFEGPGYERVTCTVTTSDGELTAWVYALRR